MSDELLVRHCSPTLAGMKTGSLFTSPYADESELRAGLRRWNRLLNAKGIRMIPLRAREHRALVYVYRPSRLIKDWQCESARGLLRERGYAPEAPDRCVLQLMRRIQGNAEFPHEIGLFLGYPPEDVRGFIEHGAAKSKCVGCWKVYGDEKAAKKLFDRYKKCTDVYCAQLFSGKSLERLAVADHKYKERLETQ